MKINFLSYFLYSILFFINCNISCVYLFIFSYFTRKVKRIRGDGAKEKKNHKKFQHQRKITWTFNFAKLAC